MGSLRRVEALRAGPSALGILVPPGRRTFLILRPRALSWDLLLLRADATSAFRELHRDEANTLAQEVSHALTSETDPESVRIEEIARPDGPGLWLRVRIGAFTLLVCPRRPGQAYQPLVFADAETARAAAGQLRDIVCPRGDIVQEVYLNTHHFTR
jgi:hypothetical protein